MATRARIGIQLNTGEILAAYSHWDGYPGGLGYTLCDHWTDMNKTKSAIDLGNASVWNQIIGNKTDFDDRNAESHDYQNIYYGRDRGEKDQGPLTYRNEQVYLMNGFLSGEEYIYLLKDTGHQDYLGKPKGEWFYATRVWNDSKKDYDDANSFKPLQEEAIEDRIRILQGTLKMIRDSRKKVA
jgi:hypothetical protein